MRCSGRCLCGAVQFTVTVSTPEVYACHCSMCRIWGGGPAFSVTAQDAPQFEDESALGLYRSSDWAERVFCRTCGTSVMFRTLDGSLYSISAAVLTDLPNPSFVEEIFIDDKPDYYAFAGDRSRRTGAEVLEGDADPS